MKNFGLTLFGILALTFTALSHIVFADPGTLDPSFGSGGSVSTSIKYDLVAQDNLGRIVVARNIGFYVSRFSSSGAIDTSFGINGTAQVTVGAYGEVFDIAIQPDKKIVLVGWMRLNSDSIGQLVVVRLDAQGALDHTFGNGGVVRSDWGPNGSQAFAVKLQPNGKIVVAGGISSQTSPSDRDPIALRFDQHGNPDPTFGTNGSVVIVRPIDDFAFSMAIQPDGKIVLGGQSWRGSQANDFAVHRLNANGTLDTSFGGTGTVEAQIEAFSDDRAWSVTVQPTGKIVLAGDCFTDRLRVCLARFNFNGDLDPTFGNGGRVLTQIGLNTGVKKVLSQSNGKLLVMGNSYDGSLTRSVIARYDADGLSLDPGFGMVGVAYWPVNSAYAMALQSDGKILLTGGNGSGFIVRFNGDPLPALINATRFDFDGDGRSDYSVFRPSNGAWYWSLSSAGTFASVPFGLSTDRIAPADFDGDRKSDLVIYRDGLWYVLRSSDLAVSIVQFGLAGDIPVTADYDGDGRADHAVFRNGIWYILNSIDGSFRAEQFGVAGDRPVVADFDGDAKSDLAVYRDGTWYLSGSFNGISAYQFGLSSDRPVVGDYDGDRLADFAVYRDGVWYVQRSSAGLGIFQFGISSDRPVPADYDGDGHDDMAVYRDGTWWVLGSVSGVTAYQFGLGNDTPAPAAFLP